MQEARLKPALPEGALRIYRGSGWSDDPQDARGEFHDDDDPDVSDGFIGFRLARNTNHEGEQHEKEG